MIVAYLILAHANPRQLARLVGALPAESPIFVHVDARAGDDLFHAVRAALASRPDTHFVKRHRCRWGNVGIVRGTMELIGAAVAAGGFDYATLLSGADYPIKSNREIAARLESANGAEFIESFLLTAPNRWTEQGGLFRAPDKMLRFHLRFRSRIIPTPWMRRVPYGLQPYGGSEWWTLSHAALDYISAYVAGHPALLRFATHSFIPDESVIQTVLSNSPRADKITGDDLRLAIWDRPEPPYPATLMAGDIDLIRHSPALFGRKFNLDLDPTIYDLVDAHNADVGQGESDRSAGFDPSH